MQKAKSLLPPPRRLTNSHGDILSVGMAVPLRTPFSVRRGMGEGAGGKELDASALVGYQPLGSLA